jgi:hypothetical protein
MLFEKLSNRYMRNNVRYARRTGWAWWFTLDEKKGWSNYSRYDR